MKYKRTIILGLLVYAVATIYVWPYSKELFSGAAGPMTAEASAAELAQISPDAPVSLLTEPDDGMSAVEDAINGATMSVDLVVYELTDTQLEQELAGAHDRGVDVRVILDNLNSFGRHPNQPAFDFLKSHGVPVEWAPKYLALTHQKTLVIDASRAFIMTFNLTPQYYGSSRDFAVVDNDAADVSAIEDTFDADWKGQKSAAGNGDDLVWSPGSVPTMLAVIASASSSLDIYNEEMADPRIISALKDAAARGVAVRVDMTYATNWKSALQSLAAAGVSVRTYSSSAKFYIHAKVIIVDGAKAFVGSENFSAQSLDANRELGILLARPDVVTSLEATFASDWSGSRPFALP